MRNGAGAVLVGVVVGTLSPIAYLAGELVAALVGRPFLAWVTLPTPFFERWIVVPGAALLGGGAAYALLVLPMERRVRHWAALVLGAALAPLNVPLSILVAREAYRVSGGDNPLWTGWSWTGDLADMILYALPVAVPAGALLGVVVAIVLRLLGERMGAGGTRQA